MFCENIGTIELVGRISFGYYIGQSIDLAFVKNCGIESSSNASFDRSEQAWPARDKLVAAHC
jgi:hypothetical protein